jgi:hypothetical protein
MSICHLDLRNRLLRDLESNQGLQVMSLTRYLSSIPLYITTNCRVHHLQDHEAILNARYFQSIPLYTYTVTRYVHYLQVHEAILKARHVPTSRYGQDYNKNVAFCKSSEHLQFPEDPFVEPDDAVRFAVRKWAV